MRRADRLFRIIQLLRGRRRAATAAWLAERLSVSERTIYRDIRDLMASGTPIEGEAGVGYKLRRDYDLPPLMFEEEELEAFVLGARLVEAFGDPALARAAESAISKVESALPERLRSGRRPALFAPRTMAGEVKSEALDSVRSALTSRRKLRFRYVTGDGAKTRRVVRPLGAFFWGTSWTVTSWCELRDDFRNFRLDRMFEVELLEQRFDDEPGRGLADYLRLMGHAPDDLLG